MGINSAPNPSPAMATLIFFMLCGRGAQQFDRTGCGNGVEYTYLRASCQLKRLVEAMVPAGLGPLLLIFRSGVTSAFYYFSPEGQPLRTKLCATRLIAKRNCRICESLLAAR